jgi:hypothetical protein
MLAALCRRLWKAVIFTPALRESTRNASVMTLGFRNPPSGPAKTKPWSS